MWKGGLRRLVGSFDDDLGLPQETFEATKQLLSIAYGESVAHIFSAAIEATDGRFYFKIEGIAEEVVQAIFG